MIPGIDIGYQWTSNDAAPPPSTEPPERGGGTSRRRRVSAMSSLRAWLDGALAPVWTLSPR